MNRRLLTPFRSLECGAKPMAASTGEGSKGPRASCSMRDALRYARTIGTDAGHLERSVRTQDAFIPVGTSYVITDVGQAAYLSAAANVTAVSPTEAVEIELPFLRLPATTHGYSQAHHEGYTARTENSLNYDSIQNNELSRSFGVWKGSS